jgi:hypothetical protein
LNTYKNFLKTKLVDFFQCVNLIIGIAITSF